MSKSKLSEDLFKKILEATPDAIVIINKDGCIVFVNTQTEKLFGYTKKELIGKFVEILIPEPYRDRHPAHRHNFFKRPKSRPMGIGMELFGQRKNGDVFSVEISLSPFEINEDIVGLAAIRDITDRKYFEQILKDKNVELKDAILAKDRFLASMSHELRTPLNAVIGFTGTLLMKLPGPLTKEQEKQLKIIQGSAKHLLSLINDLLDLAKIESGKLDLKLEKVSCQEVISEVFSTLTPLAEKKQLKFSVQLPAEEICIQTDKRTLSQIIINLTNNALKFTEHGEVSIHLVRHKLDDREFAFIEIWDTGIGIKSEDQPKLFAAFQKIVESGKPMESTGLGLHLSQKLAGLINASIEFESKIGEGSKFKVKLPI